MKRLLAVSALAAMALAAVPSHAADTTGSIKFPTATVSRAHRCAYGLAGNDSQGLFGWTISVQPGAQFTLRATDANAAVQDLNIFFYTDLTPCDENAKPTVPQHTNVVGNEAGLVPETAGGAIVYLSTGADATFAYTETAAG